MQQTTLESGKIETTLKTEEKTINYAHGQIEEGDLMSAKSILDQSYKKLEQMRQINEFPELERWRLALL